jgi:hypothetical protein
MIGEVGSDDDKELFVRVGKRVVVGELVWIDKYTMYVLGSTLGT